MKRKWVLSPEPPEDFFHEHPELPEVGARLLYNRGLRSQKDIDEFLHSDYTKDVHDPFLFRDMKKAVDRIFLAIEKREKITVHGDYDADGVCAAAIIYSTLKKIGAPEVEVFLPHRETDGYGLNKNTARVLSESGTKLLITCDCGISNSEEVALANSLGVETIITDHHSAPPTIPAAHAIIHPGLSEETYPDRGLCGGGVAFKMAQAVLKQAETLGIRPEPNQNFEGFEKWLLDLVAIASVADMVPLRGESRTLTKYGLIVLNKTRRLGLQKLLLTARLLNEDGSSKYSLDTDKIAFQIAPRLNAAGRVNHANVSYELLVTENPEEAAELAFELEKNNQERQKTTEDLFKKAVAQIEKGAASSVIFVVGEDWPIGLIGLIAGKLKEKYQQPAIVMTTVNNEITGSGRSIEGFNLIESIREMSELFSKFGGHPMAFGFTLKTKDDFKKFCDKLTEKFIAKTAGMDLSATMTIDSELSLEMVNWELYDLLEKFSPFGQGNEKPKYLAKNLNVAGLEPVGNNGKHLRIMVREKNGKIRKTIGWRLCGDGGRDTNWCRELKIGDKIDLVYEIEVNQWNGNRELQLTITDIKKSEENLT